MHIRMTGIATIFTAVLGAAAVALGGVAGADSTAGPAQQTALVVDASLARDGRDLVDPRLDDMGAEVRLPRTAEEARRLQGG